MTYILDTSALLIHYKSESGASQVRSLFESSEDDVGLSVLSLFEFELWLLRNGTTAPTRKEIMNEYLELVDFVEVLTPQVTAEAVILRSQAAERIPAIDTLIASTALLADATLVHRDAHFSALPTGRPAQLVLPSKV